MRIYSAESMETLRARKLLKEWMDDGLLGEEQYARLEQETPCGLRTTNIFLRGVLFFFTVVVVGAATGLFSFLFLPRSSVSAEGILFLMVSLLCYAGAKMAVAQAALYRHGIEEALAVCSVGFLYAGLQISQSPHPWHSKSAEFLIPAVCGVLSLWIWHRFGCWYMFLAAMFFAVAMLDYWTHWGLSDAAEHTVVAAIYLAGLAGIAAIRSRQRFDYLQNSYSLAEALLWSGVYLAINLKITALDLPLRGWNAIGTQTSSEYGNTFYWTTWVLIWCLPVLVLGRGVRRKDRFVIAVGVITALLTLISNKPYLGWPRHTWDPMLLGIVLTGAVLYLQRWLARGPGGVRNGFTAARLSGRDKAWIGMGSSALGLLTPQSVTPDSQTHAPDAPLRGGASGGGGASREF